MNGSDLHIDSFKLINQHGDSIDGKIYNKIDSEISSEARNGTDSVRADQIHAGINDNSPLVIIVHGFKGHAEWGFYPYVASKIAESGGIALTFNFSLNGRRLPDGKISEPEKFSQNTISREIEDLRQVIEGYATGKIMSDSKSCWNGKIYILGHSRGAAVGVLAAGRYATVNEENNHDATNDIKINKIAGWSTLGKFDRYSDRQKEIWRETGKFDFVDFRAQQKVSLDYSYWLDICENKYQTLLRTSLINLEIPVLFLHGSSDVTVPLKEIQELIEDAPENILLDVIENSGHTFGIDENFQASSKHLDMAIERTLVFFELK